MSLNAARPSLVQKAAAASGDSVVTAKTVSYIFSLFLEIVSNTFLSKPVPRTYASTTVIKRQNVILAASDASLFR